MKMALGLLLLLTGAIWLLQGLNVSFAPESFMTGQAIWVFWGVCGIVSGLAILWWERRSR